MKRYAKHTQILMGGLALLMLATGCASVPREAGFPDVQEQIVDRTGYRITWRQGAPEDAAAEAAVAVLLSAPLTTETAVQVALLRNARLQATYEDLGVAQAAVVQAGLLGNPLFGGEVLYPLQGGGPPELAFEVAFDFLDVFFIPLRRRVAKSSFAAAKQRVTGAVLGLAGEVEGAFYQAQAARQRVALWAQVGLAAEASYEYALRLHAAGNIPALDLHNTQALFEEARMGRVAAEAEADVRRDALAALMGLWGPEVALTLPDRLPDVPAEKVALAGLDELPATALAASLDLAAAAQDIETYAARLGLTDVTALLPDAEIGVAGERETAHSTGSDGGDTHSHDGTEEASDTHKSVGPVFGLQIPLFDAGQARRSAARADLRRRQATYAAVAVEVRAAARQARRRLEAAHHLATQYRDVLVPLRAQITREAQEQYNAMQLGPFQLLQAKQQEIAAGIAYIDALERYWLAQTTVDLLRRGHLANLGGGLSSAMPNPAAQPGTDEH